MSTLTVKQVASMMHVTEETIRIWIRTKRLRAHRPGGRKLVILHSDVEALMKPAQEEVPQ